MDTDEHRLKTVGLTCRSAFLGFSGLDGSPRIGAEKEADRQVSPTSALAKSPKQLQMNTDKNKGGKAGSTGNERSPMGEPVFPAQNLFVKSDE
jgi:hypothetical protein